MDASSELEAMVERACVAYDAAAVGEGFMSSLTGGEHARWMAAALNASGLLAEVERLNGELAWLRSDSERLDWLEKNCVNVADTYGTAHQLYLGTYYAAPLRTAIDDARALAALGGGGNG